MDSDTRPRKGVDPETGQMGSAAEYRSPVKIGGIKHFTMPERGGIKTSRGGGGGASRRQRRRR